MVELTFSSGPTNSMRGAAFLSGLRDEDLIRVVAGHAELIEALLGCRATVVLSGYASELYDGLLSGWSRRLQFSKIKVRFGGSNQACDLKTCAP